MGSYVALIEAADVPSGRSVPVQHDGRWYAICREGDVFHVVSGVCPHNGAVLGGGPIRDGCLICPRHRWPWDLKTGLTDLNLPAPRIHPYPVRIENGKVLADLSTDEA